MSTAHKPTFNPAKGGENQGGYLRWTQSRMLSVHQIPANTKLKTRQTGQNTKDELRVRDFKKELLDREKAAAAKKNVNSVDEEEGKAKQIEAPKVEDMDADDVLVSDDENVENADKMQDEENDNGKRGIKRKREDDDDEDDDSDDDDEDAALLRELEKIKKERELERLRKEQEAREKVESQLEQDLLTSNPLLRPMDNLLATPSTTSNMSEASFAVKRKWNDDVVFKNQARDEPKQKKRWVNDTIRNDFHRKFLDKYIK